jgi:PilZ domain
MSDRTDKSIASIDPALGESSKGASPDLRAEPRFSFTAAVEIYELHSQTRLNVRCSDLSAGGCYIDMISPFAKGSILRIRIEHEMREFQATAVVAYAHPSMGMGIRFTEIKPEHREVLRYWIAGLSGQASPEPPTSTKVDETFAIDADSSAQLVFNELISLLVRKRILTENEMTELLMQLFR